MTQLEALLKLGMTEAEAREVLEADKRIDKGENLIEFSAEQKAVEKKMRQADRTPTVYNFNKRERKSDNDKRFLMDSIWWMLTTDDGDGDAINATEINIINREREIEFIYNNRKFKIVLSAPRK